MELIVEYLVFAQKNRKCSNTVAFNNLIGINADLVIDKNQLIHKGFKVHYEVSTGKNITTEIPYFHVKIRHSQIENIEKFIELQKELRGQLQILSDTPQILYDSVSLYFSQQAYPKIFEVENLMRKLITKFMFVNVGIDWIKERMPEDVKKSIHTEKVDSTYLYNLDFIKLDDILFSENYPKHREDLISKLKASNDLNQISIEEIKSLLPSSNWDKFFSREVPYSGKSLSDQWNELYKLRCQVAHNTTFTKSNGDEVEKLTGRLKRVLLDAISKLDDIDIPLEEKEELEENLEDNIGDTGGTYLRQLFALNLLKVGDIIEYQPAIEQGVSRDKASALIMRKGLYCLQIQTGGKKLYSFSKLRGIMVREFQIEGIRPEWGFGLWNEWTLNQKRLSDLVPSLFQ